MEHSSDIADIGAESPERANPTLTATMLRMAESLHIGQSYADKAPSPPRVQHAPRLARLGPIQVRAARYPTGLPRRAHSRI